MSILKTLRAALALSALPLAATGQQPGIPSEIVASSTAHNSSSMLSKRSHPLVKGYQQDETGFSIGGLI